MRPKGRKKIENWLITYADILNVTALERKVDIQRGTIQKFVKYNRKLDNSIIKALEEFLKDLC